MNLKELMLTDVKNVFLNENELAERHTVIYDGKTYGNITLLLSGPKEQDRRQLVTDHIQGLYLVTSVMHCAVSDLDGVVPEKGTRIKLNDGDFYHEFYVASSICEFGMIRLELEAIDE